jgi:phospholipid/cholesterol/gamma-HCH transport system substrate-binding protein
MPNTRLAAVGAFVIGGLLLFAVGLFLIGSRRMLFTEMIEVRADFIEVAALESGAKVRVGGMDAGEVEEIQVPSGPSGRFRVRMRVREDLHPLIRQDSVASIQTDGLVGNKFVQIQAGTDASPLIQNEGTIQSREPFDLTDLMQMMSDTISMANTMLTDVKGRLDEALVAVSTTAHDAQALMNEMGGEVRGILKSVQLVSTDVTAIVANVRQGKGTVGKLMTDDALYASVKSMAGDAEKAMATVREASLEAKQAIADLRGDKGPVKGLTGDAQQTLRSARDAMEDLAEATEALKRNFLFRGFFNRRGYFDLDDLTVEDYRRGAVEGKDRRVLRIWIAAARLFERDTNGRERLTADGMGRLDSAMSQFVRYPPRSPFVVEGYADDATGDARYLSSRARAELVRDYLVGKFTLDATYVTTMPMGREALGSPDGDHWDGIGLAMFVPKAATGR